MGRTEFLTWKTITASLRLEKATPSTRAKWRSSLSACSRALEKGLTQADIVRDAMFTVASFFVCQRNPKRLR